MIERRGIGAWHVSPWTSPAVANERCSPALPQPLRRCMVTGCASTAPPGPTRLHFLHKAGHRVGEGHVHGGGRGHIQLPALPQACGEGRWQGRQAVSDDLNRAARCPRAAADGWHRSKLMACPPLRSQQIQTGAPACHTFRHGQRCKSVQRLGAAIPRQQQYPPATLSATDREAKRSKAGRVRHSSMLCS